MKGRVAANLALPLVGALAFTAVLFVTISKREGAALLEKDLTLRVSSPYLSHDLTYYDPLNVRAGHQMCITDALFSKLVEFGEDDRIRASLATSFSILGPDEIVFEIGSRVSTASGHQVTADDVAYSLKRLVLKPNAFAHNIKDLIDGCDTIKQPDDECDGIKVDGNRLRLKTKIFPDLVLESLSTTAYSIIPRVALEKNASAPDWRLADIKETGGPYSFDSIDDKGFIQLVANPNHFAYHPRMPQRIVFVGVPDFEGSRPGKIDSLSQFLQKEVDQVPTFGNLMPKEKDLLIRKADPNITIHGTHPLRVASFKFTRAGRKLPRPERLALARKIRQVMLDFRTATKATSHTSNQYIPNPGFGSLSDERVAKYLSELEEVGHKTSGKGIRIEYFSYMPDAMKETFVKYLPDLEFVPVGKEVVSATDRTKTEKMDVILSNEMPGINESYSSISWAINAEVFPLTQEEGKEWLAKYVKTESWEKRREMYRELHWQSLVEDPTIVPISHFPFYAFTHKPWTTPFPKFYSSNPFHMMRYGNE